ncbi:MAG TPA: LLM class flavin-dependent oxidoreductase [Bosea sp. (in: a-proteobacteria)]|jgi:alkanesulfonate monooxygenase SsuD/methylene tetrahydromethanopterin reductase-like flavin-dependent oxidoreductase (luciferase family)|nr:LLM class flavin-dependent oxidoreductase [Bosea sp. (in: a-proteobacteria)]
MHVGYSPIFQNLENRLTDREIYIQELRLAEMAEGMGFESIWESEHHFTDYEMTPDVMQFLTYMAGRTKTARLGSMVVVLPWHNPLRVAENVSLLDHFSNGRAVLGIGRGLGKFEMEGWGVDMNNTRGIFNESAEAVLDALENGYMEHHGEFVKQPRREIRPAPFQSFQGRSYGAGNSPDSLPVMARLGLGALVFPFKAWADVRTNLDTYRQAWREFRPGTEPPKPGVVGFCVVDKDPAKAEALAMEHIGTHYKAVLKTYDFGGKHFAGMKGYEHYAKNATNFQDAEDQSIRDFVNLMPWGTPEQVLERFKPLVEELGLGFLVTHFRFGHMGYDVAEASMRLFAEEVLPTMKTWNTGPFAVARKHGVTKPMAAVA